MCFGYQRIKIQWKNRSKFSHLFTVRAEGADPPPLTASLTVKYPFFDAFPDLINTKSPWPTQRSCSSWSHIQPPVMSLLFLCLFTLFFVYAAYMQCVCRNLLVKLSNWVKIGLVAFKLTEYSISFMICCSRLILCLWDQMSLPRPHACQSFRGASWTTGREPRHKDSRINYMNIIIEKQYKWNNSQVLRMNDKSLLRGSTKQTLNSEETIWKLVYAKVVTLHNE